MNEKLKDFLRPFIPDVIINMREEARNRRDLATLEQYEHMGIPYSGDKAFGVNFYGDNAAGTGLSRSASIIIRELKERGVPVHFHRIEEWSGQPVSEGDEGEGDYAINIFHLQPAVFLRCMKYLSHDILKGHYNIAYWLWETPDLPPVWKEVCDFFDEIWCPSEFIAEAVRKVSTKKVFPVLYGFYDTEERDGSKFRKKYGIPEDGFVVLILYDAKSSAVRKNPDAAVKAFVRAFPEMPDDVYLILKGKNFTASMKRKLMKELGNRKNVIQIDKLLPWDEVKDMEAASDVLISLHRAEGFGLPLAEMMSYGAVVVGTDYSSTTEFMDESCGCPVKYSLVRTKVTHKPYVRGTVWAEPDTEDAAEKIRKIYEDRELAEKLGEAAKIRIREALSPEKNSGKLYERLKYIYGVND